MTERNRSSQVCIWETDGVVFEAPIGFVRGMGKSLVPLRVGCEIDSCELGEVTSKNDRVKIHEHPGHSSSEGFQLILLTTDTHELAYRLDRLLYFGEPSYFEDAESRKREIVSSEAIDRFGLSIASSSEFLSNKSEFVQTELRNLDTYILFEGRTRCFAISAHNVMRIGMPSDAEPISLVSSAALGFIRHEHLAVPILSYDEIDLKCDRIIVTEEAGLLFGFPVKILSDLVRNAILEGDSETRSFLKHEGKEWELIKPSAICQGLALSAISDGYRNVFAQRILATVGGQGAESAALVEVDLGERVCVPIDLILSIELMPAGFDGSGPFAFRGEDIRYVEAQSYYGLVGRVDDLRSRRVLILERSGIRVAVGVNSVNSVIFIDDKSKIEYGSWVFREMSRRFQGDVHSLLHVSEFYQNTPINLMIIRFASLLASEPRKSA